MGAALIIGVGILAIEGYYVVQFYRGVSVSGNSSTPDTKQIASGGGGTTTSQFVNSSSSGQPSVTVFVHRSTPSNTSANSTYIDSPLINNKPDALLSITQNWNPRGKSGVYNNHPVGVWYDATRKKWAIFNQDRAKIPRGASFNVLVSGDSPTPK